MQPNSGCVGRKRISAVGGEVRGKCEDNEICHQIDIRF